MKIFFKFLDIYDIKFIKTKIKYFLVDCMMHFGTVPGLELFRKQYRAVKTCFYKQTTRQVPHKIMSLLRLPVSEMNTKYLFIKLRIFLD